MCPDSLFEDSAEASRELVYTPNIAYAPSIIIEIELEGWKLSISARIIFLAACQRRCILLIFECGVHGQNVRNLFLFSVSRELVDWD